MRRIRGRNIALVLQSPLASLNPALRIETQLREAWRAHERPDRKRENAIFAAALESVHLPTETGFLRRYASQLSVGQAQRVLIAMATLHRPQLLIADEPTSALDMVTQSEVLRLFSQMSEERNMAVLFISHDLGAVASICNRICILREGTIVKPVPRKRSSGSRDTPTRRRCWHLFLRVLPHRISLHFRTDLRRLP